jgi:hypothetical protein
MIPHKKASTKRTRSGDTSGKVASAFRAMAAALDRDRPVSVLLLASFVIGAAYCYWIFDIGFLTGRSGYWINSRGIRGIVGSDISVALSGYYFFVREHWQLPLFHVDRLGIPQGLAIIFTDSIPILALIGRLIYALTGEVLNLFGWWVAGCFIFLGMSMTGLVAIMGQKSFLSAVTATIIALCMPPLLWRSSYHLPLTAHFEIVLALIFYFSCKQRCNPVRFCFAAASLLLVLALWTNAYIFLAVGGVVVAGIGQALLDRRLTPIAACIVLSGLVIIVATVMLLSGYLESPGTVVELGFGHYSMNLLSPISPQMSGLFPMRSSFVLDATGGQYEGFSYLGGGVLLLSVLAAHSGESSSLRAFNEWAQRLKKTWRNHACLWLVMLGFTAFALSNNVYFGAWSFSVPLPSWLLQISGTFRSSGRLFWPVLYLITAVAMVAVATRYRRIKTAVLIVACFLQWFDTVPLREAVAASTAASVPPLIRSAAWRQALARHHVIRVFPSFACLNRPPYAWTWSRQVAVQLQLFAALENVAINTHYSGRPRVDCASEATAAAATSLPVPGELVVFFSEYPDFAKLRAAATADNGPCRAADRLVVCSRDFGQFDPRELLVTFPTE